MRLISLLIAVSLLACKSPGSEETAGETSNEINQGKSDVFTMVFASCSDQDRVQPLWKPINQIQPDLFVWGGDNIYADTDDMEKMKADYEKVRSHPDYAELMKITNITGTWDDHDYGKNDAGVEWEKKDEAKELMLDFLDVPLDDPRRNRPGVYTSETYKSASGSIKLLLLDTRYFRTPLKKSDDKNRRYDEWETEDGGTVLGEAQWEWLEEELEDDTADFTVIVSSIQFLNDQHGWEKWANHPVEVEKMYKLVEAAKARNILILSGDRHLAEISLNSEWSKPYPLVDFTSSGMTHTFVTGDTEPNPYRVSNIIKRLNFGVLFFDFESSSVTFEIRGEDNFIFERFVQQY